MREVLRGDEENYMMVCNYCSTPFYLNLHGNHVIRTLRNEIGQGSTSFVFPKCPTCNTVDQSIEMDIYQGKR